MSHVAMQGVSSSPSPASSGSSARMTLTLTDRDTLRGTTSAILLERIGRVLWSTTGGIGTATAEANEYDRSFPVRKLDIFFSHSWHAKWYMKYLTLLFYFNAMPAFCGAACVGLLASFLRSDYPDSGCFSGCFNASRLMGAPLLLCLGVGSFTFLTLLLSWHRLIASFGHRWTSTIFLDKVCIHQTNMEKKTQGIRAIGSILSNSQTMLVAWDHTYFARLWCVFELSAYKQARPDAKIKIIPVTQGGVTAALVIGAMASEVSLGILSHYRPNTTTHEMLTAYVICLFPFLILCTHMLQQYLKDIGDLQEQLSHFSVKKAECFCCANDHKHPDTGAHLPCDRQVVNNSIMYWFGRQNSEDGLDIFDNIVRTSFQKYIWKRLGSARLPYRLVVLVGLVSGLATLDWASVGFHGRRRILLEAWQWCFIFQPMTIGVLVKLMSYFFCSSLSCMLQRCVKVGFALVACAFIKMLGKSATWFNSKSLFIQVCWNFGLVSAVWFIYFKPTAISDEPQESHARDLSFHGDPSGASNGQAELADLHAATR